MSTVFSRKPTKDRTSKYRCELTNEISPELIDQLTHIDETRRCIRVQRKNNDVLRLNSFTVSSKNSDPVNAQQGTVLAAMMKIQENLAKLGKQFSENSSNELGAALKRWHDRCEQILEKVDNMIKTLTDVRKLKEKLAYAPKESDSYQLQSKDNIFSTQKEELILELFQYRLEERVFEATVHNFLQHQEKFLKECIDVSTMNIKSITTITYPNSRTFFGTSMADHLDEAGYSIPLKRLIHYLVEHKLYNTEGIFRVPGQVSKIALLRKALDNDFADDLMLEYCGVFAIADVIKQYLREISEPILTDQFIDNWTTSGPKMHTNEICGYMQNNFAEPNRRNFILLLHFLAKILENVSTTKMNTENLTMTLYINLYRRGPENRSNIPPAIASIVQYLISHNQEILSTEKDLNAVLKLDSTESRATPNLSTPNPTLPGNGKAGVPPVPLRSYTRQNSGGQGKSRPPPPVPLTYRLSHTPPLSEDAVKCPNLKPGHPIHPPSVPPPTVPVTAFTTQPDVWVQSKRSAIEPKLLVSVDDDGSGERVDAEKASDVLPAREKGDKKGDISFSSSGCEEVAPNDCQDVEAVDKKTTFDEAIGDSGKKTKRKKNSGKSKVDDEKKEVEVAAGEVEQEAHKSDGEKADEEEVGVFVDPEAAAPTENEASPVKEEVVHRKGTSVVEAAMRKQSTLSDTAVSSFVLPTPDSGPESTPSVEHEILHRKKAKDGHRHSMLGSQSNLRDSDSGKK